MKPVLFAPSATSFNTNGLGTLVDCISCSVKEERNGEYELEMTYPVSGRHFSDIEMSGIICAEPAQGRSRQPFRIYKITRPINGKVKIYAQHISYQLTHIPVFPFSAQGLANALNGFRTNAAQACPFTFTADFTSSASYAMSTPASIRSMLGGTRGSIIDVYGGEWEFDGYACTLHKARGADRGVTLRYGKNIIDINQETNIANTYTGIVAFWKSTESDVSVNGTLVQSPTAANFPYPRSIAMDVSDKFDNQPTPAQLNAYASAYINRNGIGVPGVSIKVNFVDLSRTMEYAEIAPLERVFLCDTVTVIFDKLGISTKAKVVSTTYDVLAERYTEIEIGSKRTTLATTIEDQLESISYMSTKEQTAREIDRATGVLNAGTRGHVIINRNSDGYANEILFLDNENIASAVNVLRVNRNGIGFSSDGYDGPYYQSWTIDGILSLGGVNNAYGELRILDPQGKVLCAVTKDGYTVYDSDGQTIIGQWSHDGISLKKGVIDFNWGTDTIGFYADGTKVQIGDWIVDNQSYGRGIIQSTDEKTGMSADTGDEDLLYLWAGYNDADDYVFVVNGSDAYVMHNGQAYPIGASIANLNSAVSAYIQDIESGDDDDGDEEGDGDYGQGEDYGGGYLHDNLVIDDIGATPPSDPIGFDPPS